jgi:hypothetical protein
MARIPTTYALFCEWFTQTYNRPFTATEAEFNAALRQPRYEQVDDLDITFDIETERREGWGYQ